MLVTISVNLYVEEKQNKWSISLWVSEHKFLSDTSLIYMLFNLPASKNDILFLCHHLRCILFSCIHINLIVVETSFQAQRQPWLKCLAQIVSSIDVMLTSCVKVMLNCPADSFWFSTAITHMLNFEKIRPKVSSWAQFRTNIAPCHTVGCGQQHMTFF